MQFSIRLLILRTIQSWKMGAIGSHHVPLGSRAYGIEYLYSGGNQQQNRWYYDPQYDQDAKPEWKQYKYPIVNVVMSGGGSKGYSYVGALQALDDCGILNQLQGVAGSSVGSVCAGLISIGCSPQDIADVFSVNIRWLFQDQSCLPCFCIPMLWKRYGIHPANRFYEIYGEHIRKRTGNPDITFKEVHERYGRQLCVVVTNLTRMRQEYCHPSTTPDLPIRTAVRMSMSFPVMYQPVEAELHGTKSLYSDGGMLDQYPVHCFDGEMELNYNKIRDESTFNNKTLGLYVVSETPIDYRIWRSLFNREIPNKPEATPDTKLARLRNKQLNKRKMAYKKFKNVERKEKPREARNLKKFASYDSVNSWEVVNEVPISNFAEFFVTAIETLLASQRKIHVKPSDIERTVAVNCGYIGTNDYTIEPGDREFMIRQGYICTRKFLQEHIQKQKMKDTTPSTENHMCNGNVPQRSQSCETIEIERRANATLADDTGNVTTTVGNTSAFKQSADSLISNNSRDALHNSHVSLSSYYEDASSEPASPQFGRSASSLNNTAEHCMEITICDEEVVAAKVNNNFQKQDNGNLQGCRTKAASQENIHESPPTYLTSQGDDDTKSPLVKNTGYTKATVTHCELNTYHTQEELSEPSESLVTSVYKTNNQSALVMNGIPAHVTDAEHAHDKSDVNTKETLAKDFSNPWIYKQKNNHKLERQHRVKSTSSIETEI